MRQHAATTHGSAFAIPSMLFSSPGLTTSFAPRAIPARSSRQTCRASRVSLRAAFATLFSSSAPNERSTLPHPLFNHMRPMPCAGPPCAARFTFPQSSGGSDLPCSSVFADSIPRFLCLATPMRAMRDSIFTRRAPPRWLPVSARSFPLALPSPCLKAMQAFSSLEAVGQSRMACHSSTHQD